MITDPRSDDWPTNTGQDPPVDDLYGCAVWLLDRHPRLARLAARITGVVSVEDGDAYIDLDHLAEVVCATPGYEAAWREYERHHRAPDDDAEWEIWRARGPSADEYAGGLADFLVMSSGEAAAVGLLATLSGRPVPFHLAELSSLDAEGRQLLANWCRAVQVALGIDPDLGDLGRRRMGVARSAWTEPLP